MSSYYKRSPQFEKNDSLEDELFAEIARAFDAKDYRNVKRMIEKGTFSQKERAVDYWYQTLYQEKEAITRKPLNAVTKCRLRKNFPPPTNIRPEKLTTSLPEEAKSVLRDWIKEHSAYPTAEEKTRLVQMTGLSRSQIQTWFGNTRRKLSKKGFLGDARNPSASKNTPTRHNLSSEMNQSAIASHYYAASHHSSVNREAVSPQIQQQRSSRNLSEAESSAAEAMLNLASTSSVPPIQTTGIDVFNRSGHSFSNAQSWNHDYYYFRNSPMLGSASFDSNSTYCPAFGQRQTISHLNYSSHQYLSSASACIPPIISPNIPFCCQEYVASRSLGYCSGYRYDSPGQRPLFFP